MGSGRCQSPHHVRVATPDFGYHINTTSDSLSFSHTHSVVSFLRQTIFSFSVLHSAHCPSCSSSLSNPSLVCLGARFGRVGDIVRVFMVSCLDLVDLVCVWSGTCHHRNSLWSASRSTHLHLLVHTVWTCVDRTRGEEDPALYSQKIPLGHMCSLACKKDCTVIMVCFQIPV